MLSNAVCKSTREYRLWKIKSMNQVYDSTLKTEKLTLPDRLFQQGSVGVDVVDKFNYYTFGFNKILAKRVKQVYNKNTRCRRSYERKLVRVDKIADNLFDEE